MKPLNKTELENFKKRFCNFLDAEVKSIEITSATSIKTTLFVQDSIRDFNWITLTLEFNDVSGANIPDDSKLNLLDTSDGFSLFHQNDICTFALGRYKNISNAKNSLLYITASSIKYR